VPRKPAVIHTIGHSNHPIGTFIALLQRHGIELLVDVRSTPYSRFNPQFRKDALAAALGEHDIRYEFLGEELGARSKDPSCYEDGRVSYRKLAATDLFRAGMDRLQAAASKDKVAIMCAEKEPLDCHRTILIARELVRRDLAVAHILASGEVEPHATVMTRLREQLELPTRDLFRDGGEDDDEAYDLQAKRLAYTAPAAKTTKAAKTAQKK
jgi:uncharacterized protein (DUF488 family)